jgi:hypothetical protein
LLDLVGVPVRPTVTFLGLLGVLVTCWEFLAFWHPHVWTISECLQQWSKDHWWLSWAVGSVMFLLWVHWFTKVDSLVVKR